MSSGMKWIASLISGLLVAILLLTSQQMAMARGELRTVAGEVVLCQGGVAVSVNIDQDGNPVGPAHFCPDCVSGFFVDLALFDPLLLREPREIAQVFFVERPHSESVERGISAARGPPLGV